MVVFKRNFVRSESAVEVKASAGKKSADNKLEVTR